MLLTFLGTRGNTKVKSRLHRRHSALMIETAAARTMLDCGADWADHVFALAPDAILLTHAHPDHAEGLRSGAPCPVYATNETWRGLANFEDMDRRTITPTRAFRVNGLAIRAFPLVHSLIAPAIGYRIETEGAALFYGPDVVSIINEDAALSDIDLYVGDGASPTRPLIRRRGEALFGHTSIRAQLGWCARANIPRAVFTHCGSEIVSMDGRAAAARIRRLGKDKGVEARIATDGLVMQLRARAKLSAAR